MMNQKALMQIAADCEAELKGHILPFWLALKDERGGFYGQMTPDLTVHRDAPKGIILHARILWAFSAVYLREKNPVYLDAAAHAYAFLRKAWDPVNGGMYWSLTADGTPHETDKYSYCNAFAVYGSVLYAEASGDRGALDFAMQIYQCIEAHFYQPDGYIETFAADWSPLENDHLSEHDLHAAKTMNTTLHLIEAYAELYRVTHDAAVGDSLRALLLLMADTVYDPKREMLNVFFDAQMHPIGDLHSFGHDIEASWLLDHACDCLGEPEITARIREMDARLSAHIYSVAYRGGSLENERFEGRTDRTRIWWVQAEGVIGFLNAAQYALESRQDSVLAAQYAEAAVQIWLYIKTKQIDRRTGGEWFAETDPDGNPQSSFDMAGPWKCPYHNSRMCLEVINRVSSFGAIWG